MTDLITLSCPSCGGKLEISLNATTLHCNNCNNDFIIRRELGNAFLESFAQCPICHRNDRAEKVSAIIKGNQGSNLISFLQILVKPEPQFVSDGMYHSPISVSKDPVRV
jgi:predicted RNA-binding Zn-ribbon protein involved in translation (DUF1610 family)